MRPLPSCTKDLAPGCKLDVQEHASALVLEKMSIRRVVDPSERHQSSQDNYHFRYWRSKVILPVWCERLIRLPQAVPVTFFKGSQFLDEDVDSTFV